MIPKNQPNAARTMEMRAYASQSFVFQGLGVSTGMGFFSTYSDLSPDDIEVLRSTGVRNAMEQKIKNLENLLKNEKK